MIQHDSSYHLWSPPAKEKWYLITSLDDFSRFILYAISPIKSGTSWAHILGLQTVILKYGLPFSYYVDCHSIFRFVQGRDSFWCRHYKLTDEASPHVAGLAGLLASQVRSKANIREAIESTSDGSYSKIADGTKGRINAHKAVDYTIMP